ncbi:Putative sensor [Halostagnicola kamekurae]|uniref:Putative sensor n=2 Tax=Halostagnicola kamekurae TaxID=619731 RepID=A0A1I6RL54_9EURY|nr:Putative sensor [Halostagnicola kamekurae]
MPSHSTEFTPDSGHKRLWSPVTDPQTYRNVAFLLLRLPLGVGYFTVFLTGLAIGVALTPVLVGIPVLGFVLGLTDYASTFEAKVISRLLGIEVGHTLVHDPTTEPLVSYIKTILTDPQSYLLVGYFLVSLFVGIGTFLFVVVVASLGMALIVAPLVYPLPFTQYEIPLFDSGAGPIVINTLPEAVVASLVGLAVLLVGFHGSNLLATAHGRVTAFLLANQ